jgi:hypothetical protein
LICVNADLDSFEDAMDHLAVTAPSHQIERIFDTVVAPLKGPHVPDDSLTPHDVVVAAYEWAPGCCFRCRQESERTAVVGRLAQPLRKQVPVRACEPCVVRLERTREMAAERYGWPYVPGTPAVN